MIISHKYKFIFIKTKKTAGTSIEVFLSQCCGDEDIVTPIQPAIEPHRARNYRGFYNPVPELFGNGGREIKSTLGNTFRGKKFFNHISAAAVKYRVPEDIWNTYFKFCVERNPWDKTLSHYYMVNDREDGGLSLDEYIDRGQFCINCSKYTDLQGHVMVDRVIKYESLMAELGEVFAKLDIPFEGTLGVRAKSSHRKDRKPYQEVYTDRQREAVAKAFAREIELHGYTF